MENARTVIKPGPSVLFRGQPNLGRETTFGEEIAATPKLPPRQAGNQEFTDARHTHHFETKGSDRPCNASPPPIISSLQRKRPA